MAHLLPSAGVSLAKGDVFRFHRVMENTACDTDYDDIPPSIFEYKWTDYKEEEAVCQGMKQAMEKHQEQVTSRDQGQSQPIGQHRSYWEGPSGGGLNAMPSVYGYGSAGVPNYGSGSTACPPVGVDPRSLVRPLSASVPSSQRPTGKPYFVQESKPSCLPHQGPVARKGGFNYQQWLATQNARSQPAEMRGKCVPSLVTWCKPTFVDCCPDYRDPWAYSFYKKPIPYYY